MASKKSSDSFRSGLAKLSLGAFTGVKRESVSQTFKQSTGLTFGKPSSSQALYPTQSSSGFDWGGLAKQIVSGSGAASFLGLGSTGIGSIISSVSSLFSSTKTFPALQLFKLPDAVNQTVHLQNTSPASASGSPAVNAGAQALDAQSIAAKSNDIAKAVKSAMLNSHSLNDVIAEL